MPALHVEADLDVTLATGDTRVRAHVGGSSPDLVLRVDRPEVFAGAGDAAAIRSLARLLHEHRVRVHVVDTSGRRLLVLGEVSAGWHRLITRSRHMRMGSARGALAGLRSRFTRRRAVLPGRDLVPPETPLPLLPTFGRHPRRPVTTTHQGGGSPRLVVAGEVPDDTVRRGRRLWLTRQVTRFGSDEGCDVVLPGLADEHFLVRHVAGDEYQVEALAPTRMHGRLVREGLLRHGTRVEAGGWSLVYARDEHADHGRPYGGRIGGELGHQRRQPPQSDRPGATRRRP